MSIEQQMIEKHSISSSDPKPHQHYEFGTFEERVDHFCALFEIDHPQIEYEDGEPLLTPTLVDWITANKVNWDWIFVGSPSALLREWDEARSLEQNYLKAALELEPEVRNGLLALMRAVIIQGIPMDEATTILTQVVGEFREFGSEVLAKRG